MVIGAAPGNRLGLSTVDEADLRPRLQRCLGDDGPRWEPQWVPAGGTDVLIVKVSPPRPADPIYSAVVDSGDGELIAGRTYTRRGSSSVPANHREMLMLQGRLQGGGVARIADITVYVDAESDGLRAVWGLEKFTDGCIRSERGRLLDSLPPLDPEPEEGETDSPWTPGLTVSELARGPRFLSPRSGRSRSQPADSSVSFLRTVRERSTSND